MAPTPFLAHNLDVRRAALLDAKLVTSVGWIGNQAHQAECSDHNPDSTGDVHAIDAMTLVLANQKMIVQWALGAPDDLEYVINQRTIWRRKASFAPARYTGTDPHTNHVHISGRHGSAGNVPGVTCTGYSRAAETLTPEGFDMALTAPEIAAIVKAVNESGPQVDLQWRVDAIANMKAKFGNGTQKDQIVPLVAAIDDLGDGSNLVDVAALAAALAPLLTPSVLAELNLVQKPA